MQVKLKGGWWSYVSKLDREHAKELYIKHNGEIALIEIAEQLGRPSGTVRGWKSKDKWDRFLGGTLQQNSERSKDKKNVKSGQKKNNKKQDKNAATIVDEVIDNESLTDEQQLFCIYYIKCFNATKAYQKAYGCDYVSAMSNSSRLIRNDKIRNQIQSLKQEKLNRALLSEDDIFQKYMDIAFSDVTDFIEHGTEELPLIDKATNSQAIDNEGNLVFYKRNYINFKEGTEVDGSLISEVSQGKDGVKVKLQDKMKALQWLTDRLELLTTYNKEKLQLENDKLDHIKGKDNQTDEPIEILIKRKEKR